MRHQVRSSRRLEAECGRNLELLWLLRTLTPDFKTIADFREYLAALDQADRDEGPRPAAAPTAAPLQEKIARLRLRQTEVRSALAEMEKPT